MRYFIDTEFDDTGSTIELISIALVREDGESLYLVSAEFDPDKCSDWVKANVLPILGDALRLPRPVIALSIQRFLGDISLDKPEIWGYFADYDWIAFCQLWGRMLDLPKGFPMLCMDIKQWSKQLSIDIKAAVPPSPGSHNALVDAQWNRAAYRHLSEIASIESSDAERGRLMSAVDLLDKNRALTASLAVATEELTRGAADNARIRSSFDTLRADCLATYMGGYHTPDEIETFRHGMTTVCNVVDAIVKARA